MKQNILICIVIFAILALAVWADLYKWHAFQDLTHSNISFWQWQFFFNNHR